MAEIIKLGSNGNWGVKPNGVLAYNDENNVFKAIELQSSRASGATYVGEDGLIKDAEVGVPRIDWTNGVGELLLEPQRRNNYLYSEEFDNASINKSNVSISPNATISPDGNLNADEIIESSTNANHLINEANLITSTTGTYTASVFVKANTRSWMRLQMQVANSWVNVNLSDGSVGLNGGGLDSFSVKDYGNGWYRVTTTGTISGAPTGVQIFVLDSDRGGANPSYLGDGISSIYAWGAQLEDNGTSGGGDYATSYIRTEGSQVTRIADAVPGNSSLGQVINSSEGVLYFNFRALTQIPSISNYISLSDGTISDAVFFQLRNDGNLRVYHKALGSSDIAFIINGNDYSSQNYKVAYTWNNSTNTSNLFVNGVKQTLNGGFVYTDISALDKLSFSDFQGRIRDLRVYDTALDDATLTTLTTI